MKNKQLEKKLPLAFKKKWLDALRSGKFKKTTGVLRSSNGTEEGDSYCVLGVAHQITTSKKIKAGMTFIPTSNKCVPLFIRGENVLTTHLSTMNDGGTTFEELADYIEKEL